MTWLGGYVPDKRQKDGRGHFDVPDDRAPVVRWSPIQCPECGSRKRRDVHRKAGQRISWHRCRACGTSYKAQMILQGDR